MGGASLGDWSSTLGLRGQVHLWVELNALRRRYTGLMSAKYLVLLELCFHLGSQPSPVLACLGLVTLRIYREAVYAPGYLFSKSRSL